MNLFLTILIAMGGLIIGLPSFADEIASKFPKLKSLKKIWVKIVLFTIGTAIICIATIEKDTYSDKIATKEKREHTEEIRRLNNNHQNQIRVSDSLHEEYIKQIIDSSYAKSIKASNEALANTI